MAIPPLLTLITNYQNATTSVFEAENKMKLESYLFSGSSTIGNLKSPGFFFASQVFEKVFDDKKSVQNIKNIVLVNLVLQRSPQLIDQVFPGITLPDLTTEEGLKNLKSQLEARQDYQAFRANDWNAYKQLQQAKAKAKDEFANFIKTQKSNNTFNLQQVQDLTTDKRIIRLAKKIKP